MPASSQSRSGKRRRIGHSRVVQTAGHARQDDLGRRASTSDRAVKRGRSSWVCPRRLSLAVAAFKSYSVEQADLLAARERPDIASGNDNIVKCDLDILRGRLSVDIQPDEVDFQLLDGAKPEALKGCATSREPQSPRGLPVLRSSERPIRPCRARTCPRSNARWEILFLDG